MFPVVSGNQGTVRIFPTERAFYGKARIIRFFIEVSGTTLFRFCSIPAPRIFGNIRYHPTIPDRLSILLGIKSRIAITDTSVQINAHLSGNSGKILQGTLQEDNIIDVDRITVNGGEYVSTLIRYPDGFLSFLMLVARIAYVFAPFLATLLVPSRLIRLVLNFFF